MHYLKSCGFLVLDLMDGAFVKRHDLRFRVGEQHRRVRRNDELRVLKPAEDIVNQNEKRQLPLWRQSRLGFIQQKQSVASEP